MIDYGAPPALDEIEITLFGPGYGEAVAVHLGEGIWLLVDSCIDPDSNAPASATYLDKIGVCADQVHSILASHWHDDHVRGIAQLATQYPRAEFVISGVLNDKEATAFLAAYSGALSSGLSSGTRELFEVIRQRETVFPAFHRSNVIEATLNARQVRVTALSPVPAAFAQFIARVAEYRAHLNCPKCWITPETENTVMSWKTAYRSFYYQDAPEPEDLSLLPTETALLCIDVQNYGLAPKPTPAERTRWAPFQQRMRDLVIPNMSMLQEVFRNSGMDVIHSRIACLLEDGRDRSLSQKMPGWNNLLMPKDTEESQIIPTLAPRPGEIVATKTTDSALTGTNLRLILSNMGIRNVVVTGIYTDQCVSSTVRSLADESFNVVVVEDCCAAGTDDLHHKELEIINMLYCHVLSSVELGAIMGLN